MEAPESPFPKNRDELLQRIKDDREQLQRVISALTVEQASEMDLGNGWTVKDHLAHVSAWEGRVLATLNNLPAYEGLGIDRLTYESGTLDDWNEAVYNRQKLRPMEAVLEDYQSRFGALTVALLVLSEADLRRRFDPDNPRSGPLLAHIAGNTFEHYAEHSEWLTRDLAKLTT
jgi:hypothetical protein